ncbi:hypothetical protein COU61_01235 [Candidatus Pacearchaeota archaeon CG10_big_fil_rev_8_21_14_0_10_35_13]|nr:MAG: hypothetical protein COU61_01235 [Candidatus Pacearchaeota archaeon CG10_big_fil_rev_8_21_14_0_10_35_13]
MEKEGIKNKLPFVGKWTFGQRAADRVTRFTGSWTFIIIVLLMIALWMYANVTLLLNDNWDPYPFILLNFILSCMAALQAPIILMSQNREAEKDRVRVKYDYEVNRRAEKEIREIGKKLDELNKKITKKRS